MADESIQLKTLQTILIIFQSRLQPDNEVRLNLSFFITHLNFHVSLIFYILMNDKYEAHWEAHDVISMGLHFLPGCL